jgi:hypothetical protein
MKSENENNDRNLYLLRFLIAASMILVAAALRILPHPSNFTPIGAMAIFAGSLFRKRWMAFLLPLTALFAGDLFLGLYKLMFIVYISFALSVAIGRSVAPWRMPVRAIPRFSRDESCPRDSTPFPMLPRVAGAVFLGALQFFVVTNFAMWVLSDFYPKTSAGLAACFISAIPYFSNTLAGDVLFATILFGGYALAEKVLAPTNQLQKDNRYDL